jgi:hypothetical protein
MAVTKSRVIAALLSVVPMLAVPAVAVAAPAQPTIVVLHGQPLAPAGTPTGCPTYQFCSYIFEGSGQGAEQICLHGNDFTDWASHSSPFGNYNCHKHSGALVNTHTTGAELLFSGTNYTGEEACIAHGSYYADTRYNYYANGQSLLNNINSSKQDPNFSCHGG